MMIKAYIENRKWKIAGLGFAIVYSLLSLFAVPVFAAFEDTGTGARPTVMGGTYVAAGEDVQSLMYNPAGLAGLRRHELTSEYSRLYAGLTDGSNLGQYFLGYGQPIKYGGTIAVGWKQLSLNSLYTERTLSLGYGEWITQTVAAGIAVKQLHHSFESPNISVDDSGNIQNTPPSFFSQYGNASTAYSFDLGVLYRWTAKDTLGLSIQDVNEPNIALNPADHEIVPRTYRFGLSHKAKRGLTLAGSLTRREGLANQKDYTWTGAVEKWWELAGGDAFAARGSLATGSRSFQQTAMGASYRFSQYQLDYAFVFPLSGIALGNTAGTHRVSLSYRFGGESKEHVRLTPKTMSKAVARPDHRRADIGVMPELEKPSSTYGTVAGERIPPSTKAPETVQEKAAEPVDETEETAQWMKAPPPSTPPSVPMQGPGLQVPVPAPSPASAEEISVQPPDIEVPVLPDAQPSSSVELINRAQLLEMTAHMVDDYARRLAHHASAESRLAAFSPLYPALKGYVQNRRVELIEDMDRGDGIDRSAKAYESLKWNGASLQDRLQHLEQSLGNTLIPALRDRSWDMNDRRDRRYKVWLEQAIAKGRQLTHVGIGASSRMVYWGQVSKKALEFEQQPSQPFPLAPEAPAAPAIPKPVPVVTPIPVGTLETPVAVPTPPAQQGGTEESIGRPLGDGEWLYRVKEGDTLLSLAKRFYGDYNRWRDIYILNEDRLGRGGALRPGQLLVMPKKVGR